MRKWNEKRVNRKDNTKSKRSGVAINRKDLINLPVPDSKLMWNYRHVRESTGEAGSRNTKNIKIEIEVEGIRNNESWHSSLEFDFFNTEAIYCRPLGLKSLTEEERIIAPAAYHERIAYLQPMSGLAADEDKLTPGSIDVRVGMGKTADVLRNIIYQLIHPEREGNGNNGINRWESLKKHIHDKFLIDIEEPVFRHETGQIEMFYTEDRIRYDLSSGGRGFHQVLLLLAYMYSNPGRVILIDEPDAHLEVLRQREIYNLLVEVAKEQDSQLIIASHSEVVLNQAGENDTVVGIFGDETQNLNNNQDIAQFKKSLIDIGWDKYYYSKVHRYILYLEGTTDWLMLKAFAKALRHPVEPLLERPNIHYLSNNLPNDAYQHFFGLKQVIRELHGVALFNRLDKDIANPNLTILTWKKREFENYFAVPKVLKRFAESESEQGDLFSSNYVDMMEESIKINTTPKALADSDEEFWRNEKLSDYLDNVLKDYYKKTGRRIGKSKGEYYTLIQYLEPGAIDPEIREKLDTIYEIIKVAEEEH